MIQRPLSLLVISVVLCAAPTLSASAGAEPAGGELDSFRQGLEAGGTGERLAALKALMKERPEGTADLLGQYALDPNDRFRRSVLDSLVMLGGEQALVYLDQALADENPQIRAEAAWALAAWPGEASEERLRRALSDPEGKVVVAAVDTLSQRDASRYLELMIPLLDAEDKFVVKAAALAVRRAKNPSAVPALARAAETAHPLASVPATEAIGYIGGPQAVQALSRLTRPGLLLAVRQTAVRGLGANPSPEATEILLGLAEGPASDEPLGQEERAIRRIALLSLSGQGRFLESQGARVTALLSSEDPQIRTAALQTLHTVPVAESEAAVRAMVSDGERDPAERALALRVLALYDEEAARSAAVGFARQGELNHRLEAMQILGTSPRNPESRETLLFLVADPDPSISALALEYLREGLSPGEAETVARAAASEDVGVRTTVCELLGASGAAGAVPTLVTLLDDPEPGVRQAAAAGLGRLGGKDAREALNAHRMDPDPGVRSAVKRALGALAP